MLNPKQCQGRVFFDFFRTSFWAINEHAFGGLCVNDYPVSLSDIKSTNVLALRYPYCHARRLRRTTLATNPATTATMLATRRVAVQLAQQGRRSFAAATKLPRITDRRPTEAGPGGRASDAGLKVAIFGASGFLGRYVCSELGTYVGNIRRVAHVHKAPRSHTRKTHVTKATLTGCPIQQRIQRCLGVPRQPR